MFSDQTSSNIVWWPNMLMLKWVVKRLKHVWSNTDQTMDTSRSLSTRCTHARAKHVWYGCPNEQNIAHQTREQKKCFKLFDQMFSGLQILSNTTRQDQTRSNSNKQGGQTVKCLGTKQCLIVFGSETFPVWTSLRPLCSKLCLAVIWKTP